MLLETEGGARIHNPSDNEIERVIAGLNANERAVQHSNSFAILDAEGEGFIQTWGSPSLGYLLEFQASGKLYRSQDEALSQQAIVRAFIAYREGDPSWKKNFVWEEVKWEKPVKKKATTTVKLVEWTGFVGLGVFGYLFYREMHGHLKPMWQIFLLLAALNYCALMTSAGKIARWEKDRTGHVWSWAIGAFVFTMMAMVAGLSGCEDWVS